MKKADWYANIFGFIQGNVADKKFLVGIVFKDKEAGEKVFKCISAWNNLEQVDMENNNNLSFIVENDKDYSTYIYPSVNREIIKDGINGFLAVTKEEWIEKLSKLIEEPELRRRLGMSGRRTTEETYSVRRCAPYFIKALNDVYKTS